MTKSLRCSVRFVLNLLLIATVLSLAACGGAGMSPERAAAQQGNNPGPGTTTPVNEGQPSVDGPYAAMPADGVLIKFKDGTAARGAQSLAKAVGAVPNTEFHIVNGLVHWGVPPENLSLALSQLQLDPTVAYAEPNYIVTSFATPNDPQYSQQYHLNNRTNPAADIDAEAAWDITTGTDVVVAVIDTGIDFNHPDLRDNIWTNPGEIPNNNRDDDNNGYVDDVNGWDFVNNDNRPQDDNRHGSHVSGIIAASGNNGVGVTGVSWRAKIMPLKFLSSTGSGSTANSIRAIEYAVANGAKISNNSWGGGASSQALADAITASERAGHLFIAAAGNNNGNNNDQNPTYPASYGNANIISVAATTNTDALAGFSNVGARTVDVGAPGASIFSTVTNNGYANLSGTSMATPVVSGIAALLLSANPSLSAAQLKSAIMDNVDRISSLSNRVASGGRVNAAKSLASVATAPQPPVTQPPTTPVTVAVTPANRSVAAGGQLQFNAAGGAAPYTWRLANAQVGTINQNTGVFTAGSQSGTTAVIATDASGIQGQTNVTVSALALSPATAQVVVGQSLTFSVSGGTAPYTWSSSNPAVASIGAGTGVLTASAVGTVTITVRDANNATANSGSITITTQATPITLNPQTRIIGVGGSLTFTASGGNGPFTWSTSNSSVLTVNASGTATGIGPGSCNVTVTGANGVSASSGTITVRNIQVQLNGSSTALLVGDSMQIAASGGRAPYSLSSSNPNVASVDASGNVVGVAAGTVTLRATDADGATGQSSTIRVSTAAAAIPISPTTIDVPAGWWVRFSANGGVPPYTWTIVDLGGVSAGTMSETTGWFRASSSVGARASIRVEDSTGAISETGPVSVLPPPTTAAGH